MLKTYRKINVQFTYNIKINCIFEPNIILSKLLKLNTMKKQITQKARHFGLKISTVLLLILMMLSGVSWGQIAAWDFYGYNSGPATVAATTFNSNLVSTSGASNITRGSSAIASTANNSFRTTGFQNNGISTANADYFQITLTAATGYNVSLSTIDAKFGGTASFYASPGVTSQFAYSLNGTTFTLIGSPVQSSSLTMTQINLTGVTALQNIAAGTTITLRYYASGQTTTGGWGFLSASAGTNGLAIGGTVASAGVVAPTTQASAIAFSNVTSSGMKIDWTNGNGTSRAVFVKETSGTISNPIDGTTYTASTDWSAKGTQLATSGYYCVYNGTSTTVTLTNLAASTAYYVQVFEYNGTAATSKYYTATATNNPNNHTTSAASTPLITVTGTINAFANTLINSTSAEQNYNVSGANLTNNIAITPPSGFEISTGTGLGFSPTNPITLTKDINGTVAPTPIYIRFAPTAAQAYSGFITHISSGAVQADQALSGTGIKAESTNHCTNITSGAGAPSYSAIIVSWTDATSGILPDGYLIKGSTVGYSSITAPIDGTIEADGGLVKNIAQGMGIYEFTGLSTSTPYYFRIFPYTNSGSTINYKTDGTVPETTTTTDALPVLTYTWNVASGSWNTAASWTPARTFPAISDILVFDGSTQSAPSVTLNFSSPQSIGRLKVINNANVTFATSDAARTLNIGYAGVASPQLEVASGSILNVSAANAVTIKVLSGFTGSISGNITFSASSGSIAHKLLAGDASGITFNSGSTFTAGANFSGNAFGAAAPYNAVIFASGSTYIFEAGSNPFGALAPSSVVVFQTGSSYKQKANLSPSLSGRTFANLEIDFTAFSQSMTGAGAFTCDNFTITNATTVGFNLTGGVNIKGNIAANSGSLSFSPASLNTINFNGSSTQTISGSGTLTFGSNASIVVDNAVVADRNVTFGGNLTINAAKSLTVNAAKQLTVTGTLTNNAGTTGLVLKSDATGTASLIHNTAGVDATVERYLVQGVTTPLAVKEYHFVSSPLANALSNVFTGYYMYKFTESTNAWSSMLANQSIGVMKGYTVYKSGMSSDTRSFAGTLNNGSIGSVDNLTHANNALYGWNLVGNPYASPINWDASTGWTKTNVDGAIYFWIEASKSYSSYAAGVGTNGASNYIASMQGFFVKASVVNSTATLMMDNNVRVHNGQTFLKNNTNNTLRLAVTNGDFSDETVVRFKQESTNLFDSKWDANKLMSEDAIAQLYTLAGNEDLSINTLPEISNNLMVPLNLKVNLNGTYTITASELTSFDATEIYLEDLNTKQLIHLNEQASYSFNAETNDAANRFMLHFGTPATINESNASSLNAYASGNNIYINNPTLSNVKEVVIYNTLGQVVSSFKPATVSLYVYNLNTTAGSYIVKIITDQRVISNKVNFR